MRSQMTRGPVTSPRCSRRTARHAGSGLPGQARAQQAQPALAAITTAVRGVLTAAGFSDARASGSQNPMRFGSDPDDAQRFVVGLLGWMLPGLDDADRDRALEDLRATLLAHYQAGQGVTFGSATWTITATRS